MLQRGAAACAPRGAGERSTDDAARPAPRAQAEPPPRAAGARRHWCCRSSSSRGVLCRADRRDARAGVIDTDIARILPAVTAALKSWDGRDLPPESAYAALDRRHPRGARSGARWRARRRGSTTMCRAFARLLFTTGRQLPDGAVGLGARDADRHRSRMGRARDLGGDPPRRRPGHRLHLLGCARPAARRRRVRSPAHRPSSGCFATCSGARCGSRRW